MCGCALKSAVTKNCSTIYDNDLGGGNNNDAVQLLVPINFSPGTGARDNDDSNDDDDDDDASDRTCRYHDYHCFCTPVDS